MTTRRCSTLSPWSCLRPSPSAPPSLPRGKIMLSWIARRMLRRANRRYGYDTSGFEMMLSGSPAAFFKFARLAKAANHREVVPVEASFAAKIIGALAEDCGPCTQLVVDQALEAGMPGDQIEAVLRRDPRAMNDATML